MRVEGVNGRLYKREFLEDAIKASKDYYRTCAVHYHGGLRYPHLVRDDSKPDILDELAKPRH